MKRSTSEVLWCSPSDFDLTLLGRKSATSRIGNRLVAYPVGHRTWLADNTDEERKLRIEITYNVVMKLDDLTEIQAGNISNYTLEDHRKDFLRIYGTDDENILISLVGFRVI